MGRPLKVAKATLLTMTGTSLSTGLVTVSENLNTLNIVAGMPFTPNVNRGGLTAGTTYYVLRVASSTTFSVSATQLSENVNFTPVSLTNSSTSTVLTVGYAVDTGFQNPDSTTQSGGTSTNPGASYGVVGGNTGIYGKQVLAQVAIGINGTGTLSSVSTSNAYVFGTGTDFANVATGAALQVAVANINGQTDFTDIGFVSATHGVVSVAVANTSNTGNIIGTSGNAQTLTANQPVTFDANLGGLVTGTVYYVKNIANAAAFTVSTTRGGAEVDLSDATGTPNALQQRLILNANTPVAFTDAAFVYANDEAGYIVRQKGKQKYLVTGTVTGLTAQCVTANVANAALTANTMNILATDAASSTAYVESLSNYNSLEFGNTAPVLQNAAPVIATFGTAYAANTYGGQPYPIVTINNA